MLALLHAVGFAHVTFHLHLDVSMIDMICKDHSIPVGFNAFMWQSCQGIAGGLPFGLESTAYPTAHCTRCCCEPAHALEQLAHFEFHNGTVTTNTIMIRGFAYALADDAEHISQWPPRPW